jgi:hypothetical protein
VCSIFAFSLMLTSKIVGGCSGLAWKSIYGRHHPRHPLVHCALLCLSHIHGSYTKYHSLGLLVERGPKSQSGPDLPLHPVAKLRQKKTDAGGGEKRGRDAAGPSARRPKPQNSTATVMPFRHHCQVTTELMYLRPHTAMRTIQATKSVHSPLTKPA